MPEERLSFRVAAFALLRRPDGTLLLARRSTEKSWGAGMWSLPTGHLEAGEAADEAMARELLEEVGVTVQPIDCRLVATVVQHIDVPYIDLFFEVTAWEGEPYNKDEHEHSEIAWFSDTELPVNLVPELKSYFEATESGRTSIADYRPVPTHNT